MPSYSGKFQYLDESGATLAQGPCQVTFDDESCVVTPSAGAPVAFDLGDIDRVAPGEWNLELTLFTGRRIDLKQFAAAFGRMSGELLAAWRDRTVRCLLLEDLEEIERYSGAVNGEPAEIRLYRSNLAIIGQTGTTMQIRLADLDSMAFDETAYALRLETAGSKLSIGKLAKKTDEFRGRLGEALDAIRTHTAETLHKAFPLLNPDQLQRLVTVMPEGRSAALKDIAAIHPRLPEAVVAKAVDEPMRPYFEALLARSSKDALMAGFKFVREGEESDEPADGDAAADREREPFFFWFFFPLTGRDLVAWESTIGSGRATYFFRAQPPVDRTIRQLTRGLALVNFRREPVYLPDSSLEQQPKFRRYLIGARKLPDLRALRSAYAGRAIHSSPEAWASQLP